MKDRSPISNKVTQSSYARHGDSSLDGHAARAVGLGGRGQEQTSRDAPPNQGQVVTPKQELLMREKRGGNIPEAVIVKARVRRDQKAICHRPHPG